MDELSTLYAAYVRGERDSLPKLNVQYADYAVWQRKWLEGEILREQGEYWRRTLAGAPALLELPADHDRPEEQNFSGGFASVKLDEPLTGKLKELSKRHGATLFVTLLAGWAALLARLSGQHDIVIGTPTANRGRSEIEKLIGFFVNNLAIRVNLSNGPTVKELLERVKTQVLEAQQHGDIPFEQIVELVQPVRSLSHTPLFQIAFAWQNTPEGRLQFPGLEVMPLRSAAHVKAKFDLLLSLREYRGQIVGGVEYATALFEAGTIERYLEYFQRVLEGMVAGESQAVECLPLLREQERRQLLEKWTRGVERVEKVETEEESGCGWFERQVERWPNRVAAVSEGEKISYGELDKRANQWAHYLIKEEGVTGETRVGVCLEPGMDWLVACVGVMKTGAVLVGVEAEEAERRVRLMLETSRVEMVITTRQLAGKFSVGAARVLDIEELRIEAGKESTEQPAVDLKGDSAGCVLYRSGKGGRPLGVVMQRSALWSGGFGLGDRAKERGEERGEDADCVVAQEWGFATEAGSVEVFRTLGRGGCVVNVGGRGKQGPRKLASMLREEGVTEWWTTAGRLEKVAQEFPWALKKVREVVCEEDPAVLGEVWEKLPEQIRERVCGVYGYTEGGGSCLKYVPTGSARAMVAVKEMARGARLYILDKEGEPVGEGVIGEVCIAGRCVALGYEQAGELEEQGAAFTRDQLSAADGARMFRTGDRGRWRAHKIVEFLGRNDGQVKIGGCRVELSEIDSVLSEHPLIEQCVAVARRKQDGDPTLVAYLVVQQGQHLEQSVLLDYVKEKLPGYMIPAQFIPLDEIPLTEGGTVDRQKLEAPVGEASAVYEPPQGEIETAVAAIWAEVLKTERVGRHDNFFALGGHSLLTLQVVSLLNQLNIEIAATDLFTEPTLASLANKIRLQGKVMLKDRAIPVRTGGNQPPLFLTHEGGGDLLYLPALAPYVDPEIPIYGLPSRPADEVPLQTMEGMAARMVQMIRAAQPMGPYRVGGWSFGGLLAYEIAAQLIAEDQEVEFLGLFDRPIPGLSVASPAEPERQLAADQPPRVATEGFTRTQLEQRQARNRFFTTAQEAYKARALPIPIHLFRAQENGIPDPLLGWGSVVPEGLLRVIEVPGTHFSMMSKPNIEKVGKALSDAMREIKYESRRNWEQGWSPLVLLQSGRSNELPLFCISGAGASVSSFLELTSALEQGRPVYGLESRGLDGILLPHSTVQAAAETYLQAILATHIKVPIHLLGHSFGGWKALELAVRLQKVGYSIASLTLLDTDVPDNDLTIVREYNGIQVILEWVQVFEQVLGRPLRVSQSDLESRSETEQRNLLHRCLVNEGLLPHRSDPETLRGQLQTFAAALRTHYKPSGLYEGRVQLVLATDPKLDEAANQQKHKETTEGWKEWAPNLVCIHSRANHMTLLKPPHIRDVASLIQDQVSFSARNGASKSERGVQKSLVAGSD